MTNERKRKGKLNGTIGTTAFHVVLALILAFCGFSKVVPESEEGLAVAMGVDDFGGDDMFEPTPASEIEDVAEPTPPIEQPSEPVVAEEAYQTQDIEESLAMQKEEKEKEKKKKEEEKKKQQEKLLAEQKRKAEEDAKKKKEAEERKKKEEEQKKKAEIAGRMKNVFGQNGGGGVGNDQNANGSGDGSATGTQGKPTGAAGNPQSGGSAASGSGSSWSLGGRSIRGSMPRPQYNAQEEGTVVVNIIVDKDGNVISTDIGRGTNTDSKALHKAAMDAAKQTKFSPLTNGANNQAGTITYKFELK